MCWRSHSITCSTSYLSLALHSSLPAQPATPHVPSPSGRAPPQVLVPIAVGPPQSSAPPQLGAGWRANVVDRLSYISVSAVMRPSCVGMVPVMALLGSHLRDQEPPSPQELELGVVGLV